MADHLPTNSRKRVKPGRKRRVAGWVLVVIGVLIAGVWGASWWWDGSLKRGSFAKSGSCEFRVGDGEVRLFEYMDNSDGSAPSPVLICYVHLWPFALASLLRGGWLVWSGGRARRRAMAGVCRKCGYDLRGLPGVGAGAVCPECGDKGKLIH